MLESMEAVQVNNIVYNTYFVVHCLSFHNYVGKVKISGDMTLTVNSDLNGGSPQFTLTCISTGGPATTVTWTRDSTTVTEGNMTVLDDTETAQYNHTLTVTGRKPGPYICAVENNISSNSTTYYLQGLPSCSHISL